MNVLCKTVPIFISLVYFKAVFDFFFLSVEANTTFLCLYMKKIFSVFCLHKTVIKSFQKC